MAARPDTIASAMLSARHTRGVSGCNSIGTLRLRAMINSTMPMTMLQISPKRADPEGLFHDHLAQGAATHAQCIQGGVFADRADYRGDQVWLVMTAPTRKTMPARNSTPAPAPVSSIQ